MPPSYAPVTPRSIPLARGGRESLEVRVIHPITVVHDDFIDLGKKRRESQHHPKAVPSKKVGNLQ
jgi:hypothetical protein